MWFTKEVIKEVKVVDDTRVKELEREIEQMKLDHESEKRINTNEITLKINEAVASKNSDINRLNQENAVLKEKVAFLEAAFKNLGFDVKDMKEILSKLVDGIIAKNQVKILK